MKRSIILSIVMILGLFAVFSAAQWQVQPQIDPRVGPIYPANPSYNFYSTHQNDDPYQFNWASGRWDYEPFPGGYSPGDAQHYNPPPQRPYSSGSGYYVFGTPPGIQSPPQSASSPVVNPMQNAPQPTPDDSEFWTIPTTQPEKTVPPKIVKFEGRIVAVKAVNFSGDPEPHVLLHLINKSGASGTVDVGQRLSIPDAAFDPSVKGYITATGPLGTLDGRMLLFADQISFGTQTIMIDRYGKSAK